MSEIFDFVNYLKDVEKISGFKENKMFGDLSVYQWYSENKILQFVKANEEGQKNVTLMVKHL